MKSRRSASDGLFTFLLILAMIAWAGTWTTGKVVSGAAALELTVFWRFAITSVALLVLVAVSRESLRVRFKILLMMGLAALLMIAYNFFFLGGVRAGLAGSGGVIVTTLNPLITFLGYALLYRRRPLPVEIVGVALGIVAGVVLIGLWRHSWEEIVSGGNVFFLLAATSWAALALLSQKIQQHLSFVAYSFYVNVLAAVIAFPTALVNGLRVETPRPGLFWLNLFYLAIFGTAFATTVFFRASRRLGADRAASFIFLVPALAPVISWFALGEVPDPSILVGGPLAAMAVYLINRGRRQRAAADLRSRV
jgi:drug/metabolite transporter (DMT)-like permease